MKRPYSALLLTLLLLLVAGCGSEDSDSTARACTTIESGTELEGHSVTLDEECYSITSALTVNRGALSIEPGTVLYFHEDAGISMAGTSRLIARGSADEPIELRGDRAGIGFWRGIQLNSPGPHQLEYLRVNDAGSMVWNHTNLRTRGAIIIADDSVHAEIRNSEFEFNEYAAISSAAPVARLVIAGNYFTENDYPMRLHANHAGAVEPDNSFGSNQNDVVYLHTEHPVTRVSTWAALMVDYRFSEPVSIESHVTIEPGAIITFERGAGLDINGGVIEIDAYDAPPVQFLGSRATPGHWRGLWFRNTPSDTINDLDNIEIRHAGGERWDRMRSDSQAHIFVDEGGRLAINNAVLADGDYHGISVLGGTVEGCDNLSYDNLYRHSSFINDDADVCEEIE